MIVENIFRGLEKSSRDRKQGDQNPLEICGLNDRLAPRASLEGDALEDRPRDVPSAMGGRVPFSRRVVYFVFVGNHQWKILRGV
jgi:hypothetical protein